FCVDRYRGEFIGLMKTGAVDIVFANHHEAMALYQTSDFETAIRLLKADAPLAVVTLGPDGSMVLANRDRITVPAPPVVDIVDKTGAGDLYAAGFLFGLAKGASYRRCAELGSLAAGEILTHIGARPQHPLHDLAEQQGLLDGAEALTE
ncbi:MAG: PfkB family carbohydrate kinase, partial [Hyphomicrobiales bacterium]|nr:PfkB family carbohydrate kinase [Hyphomicrobiales bacterium]